MVEAAGVEPASENAVSKEPTYLVTFPRRHYSALSPTALRTDKKRSRPAWKSRLESPDVGPKTSSLCDALSQPMSKAEEDGNLTN